MHTDLQPPHAQPTSATHSAQTDRFVHDRLPAPEQLPHILHNAAHPIAPQTNAVAELLDRAVARGDGHRPYLRDASGVLSRVQVQGRVNQIVGVLQNVCHLQPGNRVLLRGGNSVAMALAWLAVVKGGFVAVPTMPMLRAQELAQVATLAQVHHVLCADALLGEVTLTQAAYPPLRHVLGFGELQRLALAQSTACSACPTAADDVALLAFTSGTTGSPKAAIHTHRDLIAACQAWPQHVLCAKPSDIVVGSPPLAFTFGCGGLLLFPLAAGASVYFHDAAYTPESLVKVIQAVGATICYTAPTFYRQMAPFAQALGVPTLRVGVSAGEALPAATRELWQRATGRDLCDGIGATELFHIFISSAPGQGRAGAIGRVVPGYHAVVVDDAGLELPRGQVGRLAVVGPTGCKYLDDARQSQYVQALPLVAPLAGEATQPDGPWRWNLPGDACSQDADGFFFYQARTDDMIITSGYNVGGPEVEAAVLQFEGVAECAVVGKTDTERGMVIAAFVVLKPGVAGDADLRKAIQDHVKASIAPYKYPRALYFIDRLPRTETGKLQRFRLRQLANEA